MRFLALCGTVAVAGVGLGCGQEAVFAPIVQAPEHCPGTASEHTAALKVVTLNLRHDSDQWPRRFELVADEIVRLDPDLIGLQEVSIYANQGAYLNDLLVKRGHAPYALFAQPKPAPGSAEGIAIMSRWPIEKQAVADLGDDRVGIFARIPHPSGGVIEFANTHLDAHRDEEGEMKRDQETIRLLTLLEQNDDCRPTIITGDFNSTKDEHPIARLKASRFEDSWEVANGGAVGNTGMIKLENGAFDQNPRRRIDFILSRPAGTRALTPLTSEVVFKNHDAQGFYPSDHLGVMTKFDAKL